MLWLLSRTSCEIIAGAASDVLIRHTGRRRVQGGAVNIDRAGRGRTECRHWSEGGRWISRDAPTR